MRCSVRLRQQSEPEYSVAVSNQRNTALASRGGLLGKQGKEGRIEQSGAGFYTDTGNGRGGRKNAWRRLVDGERRTEASGNGGKTCAAPAPADQNEKSFLGATQKAFFENVRCRGRILF
jgi:hypothetical protein